MVTIQPRHEPRRQAAPAGAKEQAGQDRDGNRLEARRAADRLEQRVADAYPFRPELIELINHRWGALSSYRRTRGALEFLARVVHMSVGLAWRGGDAPALERRRMGTRAATSIMLLSFGGQREDQRGALEREVIKATFVSALDANNVRQALRDMEREALLYLHRRGARCRFDTVANINSLIRGERESLSIEEVLARVREEFVQVLHKPSTC